jgi:hypothetical protein
MLRLESTIKNREASMPFLDARALKIDPEGVAFLSGALRRSDPSETGLPAAPPVKASTRSQERLDLIRQRLESLLNGTSRS